MIALKRIQKFLLLPEIGEGRDLVAEREILSMYDPGTMIVIENGKFGWGENNDEVLGDISKSSNSKDAHIQENKAVLEDIDFIANAGDFISIVGPVGSGKVIKRKKKVSCAVSY